MTTPLWFVRPLLGGEVGPDVNVVNRKLGVVAFDYGEDSQAHVRGFQHQSGLPVTGVVDAATAVGLGEAADADLPPEWFTRDLEYGMTGDDVAVLRERLLSSPGDIRSKSSNGDVFDDELRRAVLRFQSANRLPLTGVGDAALSLLLR